MPPPPSPLLLKRNTSELSGQGRELLNQALGFHEWQDIIQQRPPILHRGTSYGSQAPSGISKLSRGTSEFTVDSTLHLRQRMNERVITKRELQSARKYGVQEAGEGGMVKLTHNATTLVFDPRTHRGITAYPTREEDTTVWAAVKTRMNQSANNQDSAVISNDSRSSVKLDMMTLQRFRDMGFDDESAAEAYTNANGNFREAVEDLLSQPPPAAVKLTETDSGVTGGGRISTDQDSYLQSKSPLKSNMDATTNNTKNRYHRQKRQGKGRGRR